VKVKTALFTMRLSFSGRAAHRASLSQGQVVAVEARKAAQRRGIESPPKSPAFPRQQVISLTRLQAGLPADDRPPPSVAVYDDLLGKASS